jgi:hypothetical protein
MTMEEARNATGFSLTYQPPQRSGGPLCPKLTFPTAGVDVILDSPPTVPQRIEEIAVHDAAIRTDRGVHVGSSAGDILAAYPSAKRVNSHEAEALTVADGQSALVFRFAVGNGRDVPPTAAVSNMSATRTDKLEAAELCS